MSGEGASRLVFAELSEGLRVFATDFMNPFVKSPNWYGFLVAVVGSEGGGTSAAGEAGIEAEVDACAEVDGEVPALSDALTFPVIPKYLLMVTVIDSTDGVTTS